MKSPTSPQDQDSRSYRDSRGPGPDHERNGPGRLRAGFREGTVRFMLDGERAIEERKVVDSFFKVEEEEYEIEVEVARGERNERRR